MQTNIVEPIQFSSHYLKSAWLQNAENYYVENRTIVVNLGQEAASISVQPEKVMLPRTSTILKEVSIKSGDSLLLIEVFDTINIGGIILESGWNQLGAIMEFSKNVPLWKSPQYDLGIVELDPQLVVGLTDQGLPSEKKKFQVKVNLWFSPANTNAAIHNKHAIPEFLEVHTQIYGTGRMQKFHANDINTLYEDVLLSPGQTHIPFAGADQDGNFIYPWHQYYADTDCIWMANEFHPIE